MNYQDINAKTVDSWVDEGWEWGKPVSREEFAAAKRGDWHMVLTPCRQVPKEWYPDLRGLQVLGLASGGGSRCPFSPRWARSARCSITPKSSSKVSVL